MVARLAALGHRAAPPAAAAPRPGYDDGVVAEVENALEQARTNTAEPQGVFTRVDELLSAHPELPQAAWLMAERYALEAQLHTSAGDDVAAAAAVERAQLLEGRRDAAAGSRPPSPSAQHSGPAPNSLPSARRGGARPADELIVDGIALGQDIEIHPGQHHVQLFRAQRRIAAAWVEVGADRRLPIEVPGTSCDELDLLGTRVGDARPEPLLGVTCDAWAAARENASGGLEFAFCKGSSCEPWQTVPKPQLAASAAATAPRPHAAEADAHAGSPWLTWSLVGLAAVGATGLVLWQTGAFDEPAPATKIVFTGPSAASIAF